MNTQCLPALAALVIGFTVLTASAADQILFDFTRGFDASKIAATDAKVSARSPSANAGLRVATGHSTTWPGITLPAPGGQWDLTPYGQRRACALKPRHELRSRSIAGWIIRAPTAQTIA